MKIHSVKTQTAFYAVVWDPSSSTSNHMFEQIQQQSEARAPECQVPHSLCKQRLALPGPTSGQLRGLRAPWCRRASCSLISRTQWCPHLWPEITAQAQSDFKHSSDSRGGTRCCTWSVWSKPNDTRTLFMCRYDINSSFSIYILSLLFDICVFYTIRFEKTSNAEMWSSAFFLFWGVPFFAQGLMTDGVIRHLRFWSI